MLHKLAAAATAGIEKTRIKSSELRIGMYVAQLDRPWLDSPFLVQGFVIREPTQLEQLQQLCRHVYIDITRGNLAEPIGHTGKPHGTTDYQTTRSFQENLLFASSIHETARNVVSDMFETYRSGSLFDSRTAKDVVARCVNNIIANPSSMLWLSMIKDKDNYTAEHSLNVALLSIALGRAERLDREHLKMLGECAMLHDVGKIKIPEEILNKEGNLDEQEFAVMKMHTVHGKKLLLNQPDIPTMAVEIALSHHEKLDGSGYPSGLKGEEIPYMVKIVAIADAYDAMTSGRIYCDPMPPAQALKILLENKNAHHDASLLNTFIECIGVYPIGSVAELNSGEVGLVLPDNNEEHLTPSILIVRDAQKQPCEPLKITVGKSRADESGKCYRIRAIHADGKYGIKLADYHELAVSFID